MDPPVYTRNRLVSCGSALISDNDNLSLLKIIGNGRQSLSAAVVQIFKASGPSYSKWEFDTTGMSCVVKDHRNRCYAIYLFSLAQSRILLIENMYAGFYYTTLKPNFHTFETKDLIYGLNFTQRSEAEHFYQTLVNRAKIKKKTQSPLLTDSVTSSSLPPSLNTSSTSSTCVKAEPHKGKKKKNKMNLITVNMVGAPEDFKHVSHVGWDPDKGFEMEKVDPALLEIFKNAGISEKLIKDEETLDFVYDFIEKYGGLEAVRTQTREIANESKPPPKAPPSIMSKPPARPPAPPSHPALPPPQPANVASNEPRPAVPLPPEKINLASSGKVPIPPPPQYTTTEQQPAKLEVLPARGDLLSSIRKGTSLSKVTDEQKQPVIEEGGIAAMLKKAIETRHNALNSEEDDDWADRDEWSD